MRTPHSLRYLGELNFNSELIRLFVVQTLNSRRRPQEIKSISLGVQLLHKKKLIAGVAVLALGLSACGSDDSSSTATGDTTATTAAPAATTVSLAEVKNASDLRANMNVLLGEHLVLAAKATGSALAGNTEEFTAYGEQLNTNGTSIGSLVGAAYGDDAATQFNSIWSAHNGFFVDYTQGVAAKDEAKKTKAVADLTGTYVPQFSKFISEATGLPLATVTELTTEHVTQTKAIVDAQADKDYKAVYAAITTAYQHMSMIANPIAEATAAKFPEKFAGTGKTGADDLRVLLGGALVAHMYAASFATDAALAGRTDEFAAAGDALNENGILLGKTIGSVYGDAAETQFNGIWSAHNGFFVDYTTAVAKKDTAGQEKAVSDLTTVYVPDFTKFIVGATGLPEATVTELVTMHVTMTKTVVDSQAAKSWTKAAQDDVNSAHHMQALSDPLATAIAAKFPDKFPTS